MPRGRDRKEIRDFSYGMDSTNYPGVISDDLNRMPVMENWRIRENGRAVRRGGYQIECNNAALADGYGISCCQLAQTSSNLKRVFYAKRSNYQPSVFSINLTSPYTQTTLSNYDTSSLSRFCGYNLISDDEGHLYTGGWDGENPNESGYIIDVTYNRTRLWGIAHPTELPTVVLVGSVNPIGPAISPTDTGWYYFYTYARIVSGTLIAESAPSALPLTRFTPTVQGAHEVTIKLSTDPQVTHIRFFRTTGETTGFEDGTAALTASLIDEFTIASLTAVDATHKKTTFDNTQPASIIALLDTWGAAAYGEQITDGAPFCPQGDWSLQYKESMMVYGRVSTYSITGGNRIFYTDNRPGLKYKGLFTGWMDFPTTITSAFVYMNDIIICTRTQTYRIVDGNWTQIRLAVDGIGVLANNTCDYDPASNQTLALTNKGVRGWKGFSWSDDLSYQIKKEIKAITESTHTAVALASAIVINREYYLSFRGSFIPSEITVEPFIAVGFLQNNTTISWTKDVLETSSFVQGDIMKDVVTTNVESSYNEYALAVMRVDTGTSNRLVGIEQATDKDFAVDKITATLQIPRLIHQSLDNNLRVRYMKIIGTVALPYNYTGKLPAVIATAVGDDGRTSQPVKIVNLMTEANNPIISPLDSARYTNTTTPTIGARFDNDEAVLSLQQYYQPTVLVGHFDEAYATSYVDFTLVYDADEAIELNTIVISYVWRDNLVAATIGE